MNDIFLFLGFGLWNVDAAEISRNHEADARTVTNIAKGILNGRSEAWRGRKICELPAFHDLVHHYLSRHTVLELQRESLVDPQFQLLDSDH